MKHVDYDDRLHAIYVEGAAMSREVLAAWIAAFSSRLPAERPLALADVGSGAGRFSPSLADAFGGPVFGVEPSERMRANAHQNAAHERVFYVPGRCEAIPLADAAVDAAILFGVWHHVEDKAQSARELFRVVRPGGTVLLRTTSRDRMPDLWWYPYFLPAREADQAMLEPLAVTTATLCDAGWESRGLDEIIIGHHHTRAEDFARLRTRVMSTFEHLDESEIQDGFERIAHALHTSAADLVTPVPADLLVFAKPS